MTRLSGVSPTHALVVAIAIGASMQVLLPTESVVRGIGQIVVLVAVVAAAWWGLLRVDGAARRAWWPIVAGLTAFGVGDAGLTWWRLASASPPPLPNLLHVLNVLGAVAFAVGMYAMVRRPGGMNRSATLDMVIVAASVTTFLWVIVVGGVWDAFAGSGFARAFVVALPVAHVAMLLAAVRLLLRRRPHNASSALLAASGLAVAVAAMANGVSLLFDWYAPGRNNALWLVAFGLAAIALVHPSAPFVARELDPNDTGDEIVRSMVLIAATMLLPLTMLVLASDRRDVLVAAMTAVILLLMAARIRMLITQLNERAEMKIEDQALSDQRRFSALVRHMSDILIVIGEDDVVTYASPSAIRLYGQDPTGWSVDDIVDFLHENERRATVGAILDQINRGSTDKPVRVNARMLDHDGQQQFIEIVAADLRDNPDVQGIVLTMQETTERDELLRQVRELAFRDPLTGLGNRELFRDRLEHALSRAARSGERLALLMCDLDDFKDINDTLGHAAGDRLLVEVARRFQSVVRHSDTVARLGGDEFAVLCEGLSSADEAALTARRLLDVVDDSAEIDGHHLRAGLSVGVAVDDGSRTGEELLRDADIALYEAKNQGKRRWTLHRTTMTLRNQARLQLAQDLTHALVDGDLEVAYQPIVELATGRIVSAEALARWNHPIRGEIEPDEFVDIAEASGLVAAIGRHLLEESLALLRRCLDAREGLVFRMGVNVSSRELREPALVDHVLHLLDAHRLDPSLLVLEVTETNILDDATLSLSIMRHLRERGVRFAIDDFGTGYSSLSYLRRLPVDILKIDRSFVADIARDETASDLVRAIIEIGRSLQLDVCAEGVETEAQRDRLEALGAAFAQGYWLSRPMAGDELIELVTAPDAPVVLEPDAATSSPQAAPRPADAAPQG